MSKEPARRSRKKRFWMGFLLFAFVGISVSAALLGHWTELETVTDLEATTAFEQQLSLCKDAKPYPTAEPGQPFQIHRELEQGNEVPLKSLHIVFWDPKRKKLFTAQFPMWFVRAKTTNSINLGTYTSFLAGDWENLSLSVSVSDLKRRGPGLVLDHRYGDERRVMLWTD